MAIVLAVMGGVSLGCQGGGETQKPVHLEAREVEAAALASNVIPASAPETSLPSSRGPSGAAEETSSAPPHAPVPWGTPGPFAGERAASKMISIPKSSLPRGPRKPPPNRVVIPGIGLDARVIELGTYYNEHGELAWETAPFAVGHHVGSANPGELGNVVLSGHISSVREGAVFKNLPNISVGDGVVVATKDRNYVYRVVEKKIVEPDQTNVMNSTSEETLTLITCVPDGSYTHRLIVTARRI